MPAVRRSRRSYRTQPYRRHHSMRPSKLHRSLTDLELQQREMREAASNSNTHRERSTTPEKSTGSVDMEAVSEKCPREDVGASDFIFSELNWTKWSLVATKDRKRNNSKWEERASGVGEQKTTLYGGDTSRPAIYEFAVKSRKNDAPMTEVYFRTTMGFPNKQDGNLDYLLGADHITRQMDAVLNKCDVFMRRACFTEILEYEDKTLWNPIDCKSVLMKAYDYAWIPRPGRKTHRHLSVNDCVLSQETF